MVDHLEPNSESQRRVLGAMNRPAIFDSVLVYLTKHNHKMPQEVMRRDMGQSYQANEHVQESLANA